MENASCDNIWKKIEDSPSLVVLFVSSDCPFCDEAIDNIGSVDAKSELVILLIDNCFEEVVERVELAATPMLVHFVRGEERGRAIGVDEIIVFGEK